MARHGLAPQEPGAVPEAEEQRPLRLVKDVPFPLLSHLPELLPERFGVAAMAADCPLHEVEHAKVRQDDAAIAVREEDAFRQGVEPLADPLAHSGPRVMPGETCAQHQQERRQRDAPREACGAEVQQHGHEQQAGAQQAALRDGI